MEPALNGPSANVPSISNETVPTPSLQRYEELAKDLRNLIGLYYSGRIGVDHPLDMDFYESYVSDDDVLKAITDNFSKHPVEKCEILVENFRIKYLFG